METRYRQYPSGLREVVVPQSQVEFHPGGGWSHHVPARPARSPYRQHARDLVDVARMIIAAGMVVGAVALCLWLGGLVWPSLRALPLWIPGVAVAGLAVVWVARDA